jgi:hypothetical protein
VTEVRVVLEGVDGHLRRPVVVDGDGRIAVADVLARGALEGVAAQLAGTLTVDDAAAHAFLDAIAAAVAGVLDVADDYAGGEALADQPGGAARTFVFAADVAVAWVLIAGDPAAVGRADPFGGTPGDGVGIPCPEGVPTPLTVRTSTVAVWAPAGSSIAVWGYRR